MTPVGLLRAVAPPLTGAAVTLLCAFGAALDWPTSIILGAVTWAGLGLFLYRRDPFKALRRQRGLSIDPNVMKNELAVAHQRLDRIKDAAARLRDTALVTSLNDIWRMADGIAKEVMDDPRDYPRVRKAMVHYLEHTTMIAEGLVQLPETHASSAEALNRAKATLPEIATTFRQYRDKLSENEVFDIETRLTLLERDLERAAAGAGARSPKSQGD